MRALVRQNRSEEGRPRVIVCGEYGLDDYGFIATKMDRFVENLTNPIICLPVGDLIRTPKMNPTDTVEELVQAWALHRKFLVKRFYSERERDGSKARQKRNEEMFRYALERRPAFLIAFQMGLCREILDRAAAATKMKLKVRVVQYTGKKS